MHVLCTDDSILVGPNDEELFKVLKEIEAAKLGITDEGEVTDFL